jgi:anti-sigma B factor antagonist
MEIEVADKEAARILRLQGRLDAATVGRQKAELSSSADTDKPLVVLNLAGIDFIDSTGLGMIVSLYRRLREQDRDLAITNLSPQARMLFELTRMHRIFNIFDNEGLALAE